MNKYQEALPRLKLSIDMIYSLSKFYWNIGYGIIGKEPRPILSEEDMNLIQELVDKATPKKPIHKYVNVCFNLVDFTYCPSCVFSEVREYEHHCHCGQAIDWSNDE